MKVLWCDLDGTLADVRHRRHLLPDWKAFFEAMDDDPVIEGVKAVVDMFSNYDSEVRVVLCSGRPEEYRERTMAWLSKHEIIYHFLYMRKSGDYRQDSIVKREILQRMRQEGMDVLFAIDDRDQVVQMLKEEGVTVLVVNGRGEWEEPAYKPGKLTLLVGPSGAGKTYYVCQDSTLVRQTVSSDMLRAELCGDFKDQSKNSQVFAALHAIIRARIQSGLNTCVDATNIRRKDRMAILALMPPTTEIEYVVIDRPLEQKKKDAAWRAEVEIKGQSLIERHAEVFVQNIPWILRGDNDPRVKVTDMRMK